ncbi:MAG: GNAT family N-acetyltransferase [Gemmatimonadaceae bacterium]
MQLFKPGSMGEFLALATPFLLRHEIEHALLIGIATAAAADTTSDAYYALSMDGANVVGAALRTSVKLLLSREGQSGSMTPFIRDAVRPGENIVLGPAGSVQTFADVVSSTFGATVREGTPQRIYDIRRVNPPVGVPGARRIAGRSDLDLLACWHHAFMEAAGDTQVDPRAVRVGVDRRISAGALHAWDVDGATVATAAAIAPVGRGIRIGAVYTPPELRRQGYASALVASLSEHLLGSGYEYVYLYTDLRNRTSNHIYQAIGYRAVADPREIRFEHAA